ncbi:MAG: cobaltochelatase subunit CobN, partial [Pseudomonadota bacterium]
MHLLVATPGGGDEEDGIVALGQSPGDIVILSAQDTDLALLAAAVDALPSHYPSVRLANLMQLKQPAATDLYMEEVVQHARVIIVSLLGGTAYWHYQAEQLQALARRGELDLVLVPGDDQRDDNLLASGTVEGDLATALWRYLREGGLRNAGSMFDCLNQTFFADRIGEQPLEVEPPRPLPRTQLYHTTIAEPSLEDLQREWVSGAPVAALIFYRAHLQAMNTAAIDGLVDALRSVGVNPMPIATASLKDAACMQVVNQL